MQAIARLNQPHPQNLRWFVWTIMFLLTTGVLLVTYITYVNMTDETLNYADLPLQTVRHHVATPSQQ